ncbi:MAG TPA: T9SS type A sorting domain-containing protein [Catalimonadaceae bacterium]|nr:T9SS type A sorting domain-containing protein [Catalimonadaceae bacterium]
MKTAFVSLIFLWFAPFAWGQTIEWAKSYDLGIPAYRDEYVDRIVQIEDSSYIATARIAKFGYASQTQGRIYGIGLVHLSKTGDTLSVKNMKLTMSSSNSLAKTWDQKLLIAFSMNEDTVLGAKMRVYKTDYSGNVLWMYPFIGNEWTWAFMKKIIPTRDDGCFVVGEATSIFPGNFRDGFLAKINFFGQLDWSFRYTDAEYTSLNNIEEMPDGNFILSGSAANRIWSCIIDSTGFQLSDKIWYQNPTGVMDATGVKQGINHGYYSFGSYIGTVPKSIVQRYDNDTNLIFQRTDNMLVFDPIELSMDGGYVRQEKPSIGGSRLIKRSGTGDSLWSIVVGNPDGVGLRSIAYDGLGSAVLAGTKINPNPNGADMYFIKVTNVGYPVDPLSTRPKLEMQRAKGPELMAYPNPAQQYFYLQGIKGKTKVALYNLQGQQLQTYTISPNEAIPAWKLSPGIYVWKTEVGGKVFTGKMIKE